MNKYQKAISKIVKNTMKVIEEDHMIGLDRSDYPIIKRNFKEYVNEIAEIEKGNLDKFQIVMIVKEECKEAVLEIEI